MLYVLLLNLVRKYLVNCLNDMFFYKLESQVIQTSSDVLFEQINRCVNIDWYAKNNAEHDTYVIFKYFYIQVLLTNNLYNLFLLVCLNENE